MYLCICCVYAGALRHRKRDLDLLELALQEVVRHLAGMLGTELSSSLPGGQALLTAQPPVQFKLNLNVFKKILKGPARWLGG